MKKRIVLLISLFSIFMAKAYQPPKYVKRLQKLTRDLKTLDIPGHGSLLLKINRMMGEYRKSLRAGVAELKKLRADKKSLEGRKFVFRKKKKLEVMNKKIREAQSRVNHYINKIEFLRKIQKRVEDSLSARERGMTKRERIAERKKAAAKEQAELLRKIMLEAGVTEEDLKKAVVKK